MFAIRAAALSDVGRARRYNEDFFGIDHAHSVYVVADGMGGHGNGEIASRLVVKAIGGFFARSELSGRWGGRRGADRRTRLRQAIAVANREVLDAVDRDHSLTGMGTTVVALMIGRQRAIVAHVGDSRAYRLRDSRLKMLTSDHTWVNEQLTAGNISEDQAAHHPFKSVVTRALGGERQVEVEMVELTPAPGDLFLLCSDGLTGMVDDEQIRRRLMENGGLDEVCRRLVDDANEKGGRDNITVLLLTLAPNGTP